MCFRAQLIHKLSIAYPQGYPQDQVPRSTIHLACAEALAELESRVGKEGRRKFEKFLRHRPRGRWANLMEASVYAAIRQGKAKIADWYACCRYPW
jgi:hypothetical protein